MAVEELGRIGVTFYSTSATWDHASDASRTLRPWAQSKRWRPHRPKLGDLLTSGAASRAVLSAMRQARMARCCSHRHIRGDPQGDGSTGIAQADLQNWLTPSATIWGEDGVYVGHMSAELGDPLGCGSAVLRPAR